MTGAGFPHSETLGSTLGWQLPEDYRGLPRPSSAPGAQASTVRPYTLDHDTVPTPTIQQSTHNHTPPGPQPGPGTGAAPENTPRKRVSSQDPTVCQAYKQPVLRSTQPTPHPPQGGRGDHSRHTTHNHHVPQHPAGRTGTPGGVWRPRTGLLRKEVIQPHLPVRLPCYDFVPIAGPTFDGSLPLTGVRPPASGVTDFRDVTGGVYKARERIHRGVADPRLLATPASRGRVADPDPN